ncbi:MAG: hypothetical protein KatS3mg008_1336 [Acidimicrobiales bacterium]|nr:MAG: hypothetical protein KatS3mg008_1336 [Acidimicrobiales bacterium]
MGFAHAGRKVTAAVCLLLLVSSACGGGDGGSDRTAAPDREGVSDAGEVTVPADGSGGRDGGDEKGSARLPSDGCQIVTKEDVEKLLGKEVRQVPPEELDSLDVPGLISECVWEAAAPDGGVVAPDLFQFQAYDGREYYGAPPDSEKVDGVADEAYVRTPGRPEALGRPVMLGLVQGDITVLLTYNGVGPDEVEQVKTRMIEYAADLAEKL